MAPASHRRCVTARPGERILIAMDPVLRIASLANRIPRCVSAPGKPLHIPQPLCQYPLSIPFVNTHNIYISSPTTGRGSTRPISLRAVAYREVALQLTLAFCHPTLSNHIYLFESSWQANLVHSPACRPESEPFEVLERRRYAATVLDNPELLMMHAQSRGDVSS
jgi:hypothetical protein